jgi:ABC-2 type transport system ATP-binding protein
LALSCRTKYLFFDETFDGLDPVKRALLKKIIREDVAERNAAAVITSHSLRELEDACSQLALLHKGGLIFENDVQNLKTSLFKVQIGLNVPFGQDAFPELEILQFTQSGSVANMIVRGDREETLARLKLMEPSLLDILPLTLEEVVVFEMEALGYAFPELL